MKVTVELPDKDLRDICRITKEKKKGPAIRKLVVEALMVQRRLEMTEKFMTGEWGTNLPAWQEMRAQDQAKENAKWAT
jgi:hypothetical protein